MQAFSMDTVNNAFSTTLLFSNTSNLDGLKLIPAHEMRPFSPLHSRFPSVVEDDIMVISHSNSCLTLVFITDPLHSFSMDFIMFMARTKRVADMVQPVIIPISNQCQFKVPILIWKLLQFMMRLIILLGIWCFFSTFSTNLCGMSHKQTTRLPLLTLVS